MISQNIIEAVIGIKKNLFVFDIETIPDLESARALLNLPEASDDEIYTKIAAHYDDSKPREEVFLKPIFHKIVAISFADIAIHQGEAGEEYEIKEIRSGGTLESSEAELIKGFFRYIEQKTPRLVSYNGRAFDLPVLKLRAMKHGISSNIYKLGDKWNSYTQRYSSDWHCDLHETMTDYFAAGRMKLDEACKVFGYPGKVDVDGSTVFELYKQGKLAEIRDYCETDVLNTYLVYLSYALHNGMITSQSYENSLKEVHDFLDKSSDKAHLKIFKESFK